MALTCKLEAEIEIKAPADSFFKIFSSQLHLLPNICPHQIQKMELIEGDWETQVGTVLLWNFTIDGKSVSVKEMVESIDEENMSMTFKVLEGEVLKDYNSYKFIVQAILKGERCLVKWDVEYEKASDQGEGGPDPHDYIEFALTVTKEIDSYLPSA